MTDQGHFNYGYLVPAGRRDLVLVAAANPLVSRGIADLAKYDLTSEIVLMKDNALFFFNRGISKIVDHVRDPNPNKDSKKAREMAIQDFDEAIRLNPEYTDAHLLRSTLCSANEDYDKAIRGLEDAILLDPRNASRFYYRRGCVWQDLKEHDKAINDFTESIRFDPTDNLALVNRGEALLEKKEYQRGIKDFEEAIRIDPKCVSAYVHFACLLATCPEEKVRDGKRAIQLATKACELTNWESGSEMNTLAAAYAEAGQFNEAIRYQIKVLEDFEYQGADGDEFRQRLELYKQNKAFR